MAAHGLFDYLIMLSSEISDEFPFIALIMFVVFIYFDVKLWKMGVKRIKIMQEKSRIQHEAEQLEEIFKPEDNKF